MTKSWIKFINEIKEHQDKVEYAFFRGHSDSSWTLTPSLFRKNISETFVKETEFEKMMYYDFIANAGKFLDVPARSWEVLYLMRHHGFPTRLLDWSENFGIALYFALNNRQLNKPEVWILDPFELNQSNPNNPMNLMNPQEDFDYDFYEGFIVNEKETFKHPIAIYPGRNSDRIFNQRGTFTIHGEIIKPIEELCSKAVKKFPIPLEAVNDAERFLNLAGINEYSIYHDLDALARHFKKIHNY